MEKRSAVRINGWQRLWIAIAVISLVPAIGYMVAEWESGEAWIRHLQTAAPTRVDVAGVGSVDFPATMSPEAVDIVVRASHGNADTLAAGIRAWGVEFARALDEQAAALNRLLVARALGWWAAGIFLLYLIGWLAGWVRRGFKA